MTENDRMPANKKLLMLPGDGIGPEVMGEVRRLIDWMDARRHVSFDVTEDLVGGAAYEAHGVAIADETMETALSADAVLFGAVGGPAWDNVAYDVRPEAGLLRLRKDLDLFANLRPAICFDALAEASSLKPALVSGLDILIVRELTGGVYFGEPRGIETLPDGQRRGVNTQVYTTGEIRRVCRVAFDLAAKRSNRVCSTEKSNVMESGLLWREEAQWVRDNEFPEAELVHLLADNCGMQLVRNPKQFDVIVTDNLFGDIVTDIGAAVQGGMGLAASGNLNPEGTFPSMFEPVHGSAPDIAGRGEANPLAAVWSTSLMLDHLGEAAAARRIMEAVEQVARSGPHTPDLGGTGTTAQVTDALLQAIPK